MLLKKLSEQDDKAEITKLRTEIEELKQQMEAAKQQVPCLSLRYDRHNCCVAETRKRE